MILARFGGAGMGGLAALALGCAAPAHADVMEIGADGPHWISGALATPLATDAPEAEVIELSADFAVPPRAIADAARQAGVVPAV